MTNETPPNKPATNTKRPTPKPPSKKSQLIKLLNTKAGSDIVSISTRFGWQPHTTRAALSGLRKAGFDVVSAKPAKGGLSKYRIAPAPDQVVNTKASTDGA